jgi:hypothetical protein
MEGGWRCKKRHQNVISSTKHGRNTQKKDNRNCHRITKVVVASVHRSSNHAVARLIICNNKLVSKLFQHKGMRTSRAHLIVFLVSAGYRFRLFSSSAIHSDNKSCLIWPWKVSAKSPNNPYPNRLTDSGRFSSSNERWTSSTIC